MTVER